MGLYERDYTQQRDDANFRYAPRMQFGRSRMTPAVKWLLISNIALFLLNGLTYDKSGGLTPLQKLFVLYPATPLLTLQLWRLITYQFMHWGLGHIFVNMLALFFLGPLLERHWGSKKFITFYLICGATGGLFYILLVYTGFLPAGPMAGASGAVLGILTAVAILFPKITVLLYFLIPVPIRTVAVLFMVVSVVTVILKGKNAGGEAAHLAGIAAGALYVFSDSWRAGLKLKFKASSWQKNVEQERKVRLEVDRILKKVYESGLQSLTPAEKRTLKKATRLEQQRLHR